MEQVIPKKILIVLFGAIGDVARALPLAVRIKNNWPDVELSWTVEPASQGLLLSHPAVDKVYLFNRKRGLVGYLDLIKELRGNKFDITLDLQRLIKSGVASFFSGAPVRIGFSLKNSRELNWLFNNQFIEDVEKFSPKTLHYQKFGDLLGLKKCEPLEFGFDVSEKQKKRFEEILTKNSNGEAVPAEKLVALILGSTWQSRFWFEQHYIKLIEELYQRWGFCSLLVGGKTEVEFAERIVPASSQLKAINIVGKTEISDLIALFSSVRFAVGSDSGPMHIASAVGCKVISLWGATSPLRSAPYGNERLVLQSAIGCAPCYRKICPGLDRLCMKEITPEAVLAMAEHVINNQQEISATKKPFLNVAKA
jgi:ADP-heptose:LPS heptosyltransferase